MRDPVRAEVRDRLHQAGRDDPSRLFLQALLVDDVVEVLAPIDQFHDDVDVPVDLERVVELDDVRLHGVM